MFLDKTETWKEFDATEFFNSEPRDEDIEDFKETIKRYGFTEKDVWEISSDESDLCDMPHGAYFFKISNSNIHGKGIFATGNIKAGDVIAPARIGNKRTPVGRYTNHSKNPNAEMVEYENDFYLVATRDIFGCRGGFPGEEITTDYGNTLQLIGVK